MPWASPSIQKTASKLMMHGWLSPETDIRDLELKEQRGWFFVFILASVRLGTKEIPIMSPEDPKLVCLVP